MLRMYIFLHFSTLNSSTRKEKKINKKNSRFSCYCGIHIQSGLFTEFELLCSMFVTVFSSHNECLTLYIFKFNFPVLSWCSSFTNKHEFEAFFRVTIAIYIQNPCHIHLRIKWKLISVRRTCDNSVSIFRTENQRIPWNETVVQKMDIYFSSVGKCKKCEWPE